MELNQQKGVHIHLDRSGRASGEAFVQFESSEDCEKALKRNLEKIGHRWVVFFGKFQYSEKIDEESKRKTKKKKKISITFYIYLLKMGGNIYLQSFGEVNIFFLNIQINNNISFYIFNSHSCM